MTIAVRAEVHEYMAVGAAVCHIPVRYRDRITSWMFAQAGEHENWTPALLTRAMAQPGIWS